MSPAREEMLGRIRSALGGPTTAPPGSPAVAGTGTGPGTHAAPGTDTVPREYRTAGSLPAPQLLGLLAERLTDYHAQVRRCSPGQLPAVVAEALTQRAARRVVIPPGLDLPGLRALLPGTAFITDEGLPAAELDALDGVITGAAVAIAETGTIVLDGSPGQGRRAISLIPDYHLCLIHAGQVVEQVPEAVARLTPGRPLTWISGPSATSDIELDRVEGVHGPRTLEVVLVAAG